MAETTRPLRVLVSAFACDPEAGTGGEAILGWNVVEQVARVHETWVLTEGDNRAAIERRLRAHPLPRLTVVYVDLPAGVAFLKAYQGAHQLYNYAWQILSWWAVRALHRRHRFDLFHHATYANDWMASHIGALLPVPYVRGPGGGAQQVPRALLPHFSRRGRLGQWARAVGQWLMRHDPFFVLSQRRARAILVCNEEARRAVPRRWQAKVGLFPVNGVSAGDLALVETAARSRREAGTFNVLCAGKLMRLKGFWLAVDAFARVAARDPRARLEIIGDGPDRAYLESLIAAHGLTGRVRLTRWMPREQLLAAMAGCDVFLFPSLRDGGGAVVIEAMAAGRAVVCVDLGGPGLHVTADCGIKVAAGTRADVVERLADALERLRGDDALRVRMGAAARRRVEAVYHWDRLGERLLGVYDAALARDTGRAAVRDGMAKRIVESRA